MNCDPDDFFLDTDSATTLNDDDSPHVAASDLETIATLETAQSERVILQETLLEDASVEMQQTALEQLEAHVRIHGKRNARNHKQWRDVVIVGEVLFEIDVTSNDEPDPLTEARAQELLEALK